MVSVDREPVAGANRRRGRCASAFRASGEEPEGQAPYSVKAAYELCKLGGTAEVFRPR